MATIDTVQVGDTTYNIAESGYAISNVYSTSETIIGTWTDGRPIYQKTVTGTLPSTQTTGVTANHYVSVGTTNIDIFLSINAFITQYNGANLMATIPFNHCTKDGSGNFITLYAYGYGQNTSGTFHTPNSLRVFNSNAPWNGETFTAIIQYIKIV